MFILKFRYQHVKDYFAIPPKTLFPAKEKLFFFNTFFSAPLQCLTDVIKGRGLFSQTQSNLGTLW